MKDVYITIYTKEQGKLELTREEWQKFDSAPQYHRINGPAIEYRDGERLWLLNNELHRIDGPAVEGNNGTKKWYLKGYLHREDGPAIKWDDGTQEWWLNNEMLNIIPINILINYMRANNYTLAHLLTDPDSIVRESVVKYRWKEI